MAFGNASLVRIAYSSIQAALSAVRCTLVHVTVRKHGRGRGYDFLCQSSFFLTDHDLSNSQRDKVERELK